MLNILFIEEVKMKKLLFLFAFILPPVMPLYASDNQYSGPSGNMEATSMASVTRAQFTTNVIDREPVDEITILTNDNNKIYFFSEQQHMTGQIIKHRWEYNNKVMAEIEFGIGGPHWRVYSSKTLLPEWLGEWKVSVVDKDGDVIAQETFTYATTNNNWKSD